jgi:hypothetical protein
MANGGHPKPKPKPKDQKAAEQGRKVRQKADAKR